MELLTNYDAMSVHEKEKVIAEKKPFFSSYVPNFCSGVSTVAFYFDNIDEVFNFLKEKYKDLKESYQPSICDEIYIDCKIICMQSEHDSFIAGFLYNY